MASAVVSAPYAEVFTGLFPFTVRCVVGAALWVCSGRIASALRILQRWLQT
jgi:hypothetical protein